MTVISFITADAPAVVDNHRRYCALFGYEHRVVQTTVRDPQLQLVLKYQTLLHAVRHAPTDAPIALLSETTVIATPIALTEWLGNHDGILIQDDQGQLLNGLMVLRNSDWTRVQIEQIATQCNIVQAIDEHALWAGDSLWVWVSPHDTLNGITPLAPYHADMQPFWVTQPTFALSLAEEPYGTSQRFIAALLHHLHGYWRGQHPLLSFTEKPTVTSSLQETFFPDQRIALVMLYTPNIAVFGQIAERNLRQYCERHGYTCHVYRDIPPAANAANASGNGLKPWLLLRHLSEHDWVVWLGADTLVLDQDRPLETLMAGRDYVVGRDVGGWAFNSGVMGFKNTEQNRRLLDQMLSTINQSDDRSQVCCHGGDQRFFIDAFENAGLLDASKVYDFIALNTPWLFVDDMTFIAHYMALRPESRAMLMAHDQSRYVDQMTTQHDEGFAYSLLSMDAFQPVWRKPSAWFGHLPFAYWLIQVLRPKTLVELGTYWGTSYFAFCQSVAAAGLTTRCFAVDTWQGDEHSGSYENHVFEEVSYHHQNYAGFSQLLRMTFDQAVTQFADHSVDLLHIDGLHTYDAVRHDFETWLPKLTANAVLLFHDIEVRERDFGVWQFWQELCAHYPHHIAFVHSYGLGVVCLGEPPAAVANWLNSSSVAASRKQQVVQYLTSLGERLMAYEEVAFLRNQVAQTSSAAPTASNTDTVAVVHEKIWARQFELLDQLRDADGRLTVRAGPFAGMQLSQSIITADYLPKMVGAYERELHQLIHTIVHQQSHTRILDIGCGDGFYAVGLALCLPDATVEAFDHNQQARQWCANTAQLNHANRVQVRETFDGAALADCPAHQTLIWCQRTEDAGTLLDPARFPSLATCDLMIELNHTNHPEMFEILHERFAASHRIQRIEQQAPPFIELSAWLPPDFPLDPTDGWIAGSDTRRDATPWLYLEAHR